MIIPRMQFDAIFARLVFQFNAIARCSFNDIGGLIVGIHEALLVTIVVNGAADKGTVGVAADESE